MKKLLLLTIPIILFTGCGGNEKSSNESFESTSESNKSAVEDGYVDGTYCADVDYYNPNTGTSSTYTLEVDVEGNELTKIHWPNGGWLDESHFSSTDISDGDASFTSDKGYDYTVKITGEEGSCSTTN